jgi:pimeloyl-ACP methyl ester carboxylesterase
MPPELPPGRRPAERRGRATRFAPRLTRAIRDSEVLVFEGCAHAPLYEHVEEFNQKTLAFLHRHAGASAG